MSRIIDYRSDEPLKGPIWAKQIDNLRKRVFDTQWELYALCISIGIMHDQQLEFEKSSSEDSSHSVPRAKLIRSENQQLLDFMFQTAVLTTNLITLDEEQRLELAFSENCEIPFDKRGFLTKFANFGIAELDRILENCDQDLEKMDAIRIYLDQAYASGVESLQPLSDNLEDLDAMEEIE